MIHEYKNNDSYQDLLNFALGVNNNGMVENIIQQLEVK